MTFDEVVENRRSIRKFKNEIIEEETKELIKMIYILNNNKVNITLLKEFVGIPKVVKDQTLLKVFLLDYNIYI